MSGCSHKKLTLLKERGDRLRCKKCHLVISADELGGGYCPECYAVESVRHYDFETLAAMEEEITKYRCDQCGVLIEWEVHDEAPDKT